MSFHDNPAQYDAELEARLRRIAADPRPELPSSLYRFADQVVSGPPVADRQITRSTVVGMRMGRGAARRPQVRALAVLAATLLVVVMVGTLMVALRSGGTAAPIISDHWTGLEWRDVTATSDGLFAGDPWLGYGADTSSDVVAWSGGLIANDGDGIWLSADGRTWKRVRGAPALESLGVVGGQLIGLGRGPVACIWPEDTSVAPCPGGRGVFTSADGMTWQSMSVPFGGASIQKMLTSPDGAVALTSSRAGADGTAANAIYVTKDGATWQRAATPNELGSAILLLVSPLREGYLASGFVPDPTGSETAGSGNAPDTKGYSSFWFSLDGMTWSRSNVVVPDKMRLWDVVYPGLLGDSFPDEALHSGDGLTWTKDPDLPLEAANGEIGFDGDGRHILIQTGVDFWFGLGDGSWRRLQEGGDVSGLGSSGQAFLLPDGVLYASGGRLYFGQAASGTEVGGTFFPTGSFPKPVTPTPILPTAEPSGASSSSAP